MTLQPNQEVFSPGLQHLQSADPYQVTTTLHSFSPGQVRALANVCEREGILMWGGERGEFETINLIYSIVR